MNEIFKDCEPPGPLTSLDKVTRVVVVHPAGERQSAYYTEDRASHWHYSLQDGGRTLKLFPNLVKGDINYGT